MTTMRMTPPMTLKTRPRMPATRSKMPPTTRATPWTTQPTIDRCAGSRVILQAGWPPRRPACPLALHSDVVLAAGLAEQPNPVDVHPPVHGLAHVVDRQGRDAHSR